MKSLIKLFYWRNKSQHLTMLILPLEGLIFTPRNQLRLIAAIFILSMFVFNGLCSAAVEEKDLLPIRISCVGQKFSDVKNEGFLFEDVFPEKNNEILSCAKLNKNKLWDMIFAYGHNGILTVITYVSRDSAKSKEQCANVIKMLIAKYGNNFNISHTTLDSSISNMPGYAMTWKVDDISMSLKFGPLDKKADKFQLQLTIVSKAEDVDRILVLDKSPSTQEEIRKMLKEVADYFELGIEKL